MKIGYARVSTIGQDLETQKDLLEDAGCEKIFVEKVSGTSRENRVKLREALDFLRPHQGDELVVTKIDRLARSVFDLHSIANDLENRGVNIIFLKEGLDFSTSNGKMMFTMLGAISEFEADLIRERTKEGRERAKKQGKHMGRPGRSEKDIRRALKLYDEKETNGMSIMDIVRTTGVPKATLYMKLRQRNK
ncbi:recombinase family protein [Pontibacillus sp. HN14]|uniref:recombinase family protein n=1 Tax=Pontibacillus TaxID=289201 RepID=UPI00351D3F25